MSSTKFIDEAIPLITISAENKMEINKQAVEILSLIPKPLGVVGVAGQYRTGKSYLLNRVILNQSKGFPVGPTINPCTKGIWIWGRPLKGFTKEGKNVNIIVIDSEGLGAIDEDTSHDSRIFSLVMLLSSCFVYNSTGTIDESALENLSLIVDLTKNIQIKSRQVQDDDEYENFAFYMPSFVWVVRDFSLDLIDKYQNKITSDEYFEEALIEQDGSSDQIEQKNRIRRILSHFFRERHCHTLVRPVNEEEDLKNIETMSDDKLRPQFIEQAHDLRSQILDNARIKTLEDHPLSGKMFADLIRSYVEAINQHKIPVIENCWNYICKNECHKAKEACIKMYEEEMNSAFQKCRPMSKQKLKALHGEFFAMCLQNFKQLNYGEIQTKIEEDLMLDLKKLYSDFKYENQNDFEGKFKKFMESAYNERIVLNLKNKAYTSVFELENDLRLLEKEIRESNIEGPDKQVYTWEFLSKKQAEAFRLFLSTTKDDFESQISTLKEGKRSVEMEAENSKRTFEKDKKKVEAQMVEMREESENYQKRLKSLEDVIQKIKLEKENTESFCDQKVKEILLKSDDRIKLILKEKENILEEKNQAKRELMDYESKYESEVALLKNQVRILEERKQAISLNDKNKEKEIEKLKVDHELKWNELNAKHDLILNEKNIALENLREEFLDLEEKLANLERTSSQKENEFELSEKNYKKSIQELKKKNEEITEKAKLLEKNSSQKTSGTVPLEKYQEIATKLTEVEEQLRQKELSLKMSKQQLENEVAIGRLAAQNIQQQYDDTKKQLEELNIEYEKIISLSLNEANCQQEDLTKQMNHQRENHVKEIQNYDTQLTILKLKLEEESKRCIDQKAVFEQERIDSEKQLKTELIKFKNAFEKSEKALKIANHELGKLKFESEEEIARMEERMKQVTQELEDMIENVKKNTKSEIREIFKKKDEDLKLMQAAYEEEKESSENKLNEEKDKYQQKMTALTRLYETKLAVQKKELDEIFEAKEHEMQEQYEFFTLNEQAMKSEIANKTHKINELSEQIRILNENYVGYKKFTDDRIRILEVEMETQQEQFTTERDSIRKEISEINVKYWAMEDELKASVADFAKLKDSSATEIKKLETESAQMKADLENWKGKAENFSKSGNQQKNELEKQLAIVQQENKFTNFRADDLKKQLDEERAKSDSQIKSQREIFEREKSNLEQKHSEFAKILEQKLNEKRRIQRELESKLETKISECEKLKVNFEDKIYHFQEELASKENQLVEKTQKLKEKAQKWKDNSQTSSKNFEKQMKEAAEKIRELEDKIFDLQVTIQRDKQISDQNKQHYQGIIEKLRADSETNQRRFDILFSKFSKPKDSENQDNQATQNTIIQRLTENHQAQLSEMTQKYNLKIMTLTETIQKMEKELKQLKEGYMVEAQTKLENYDFLESSVMELKESEKMMQFQMNQLRQEKDAKIKALETKHIQDIERYKVKISELERQVSDREKSLEKTRFTTQTDKTRANAQMETLKSKIKNLQEQIKDLEESKTKLGEEYSRLKIQTKTDKLISNGQSQNARWKTGGYLQAKMTDQSLGDSIGENVRNQLTKDMSKAFVNDENSEHDLSSNQILRN